MSTDKKDNIQPEHSKVISLEEIVEKAKGYTLDIPDWDGQGTITVRIRSIDLTPHLLSSGVLPNQLSAEVATAFGNEQESPKVKDTKFDTNKLNEVIDAVVKEALVEPTFEQIQEVYPLNLTQKMAIFTHITGGVEKLKPFRQK